MRSRFGVGMGRRVLTGGLVCQMVAAIVATRGAAPLTPPSVPPPSPPPPLALWYRQPAREWLEALPVGNGRLGGMVFGGADRERVQLNEDTLWSGGPTAWDNPQALEVLPEMRRLVRAGQYAQAHQLGKKMMGPYNQSYMPMGDLRLAFAEEGPAEDYRRDLDLDTGIASVRYRRGGVTYTRETFVSRPDQVLVVRLTASQAGKLSFTATLESKLRFLTRTHGQVLVLKGRAPAHVDPNYYNRSNAVVYATDESGEGMRFECHLRAVAEGGSVAATSEGLAVNGANAVTLILSAATGFNGFNKSPGRQGKDPAPIAARALADACRQSYATLRTAHVEDHQRLFRRVELDLGPAPAGAKALPTAERMSRFGAVDPEMVVLHFQYGRYLTIASARPGTQPPNLQGIWNDEIRPPWSANWTLNINAEMNAWPAEVCNLSECHEPLFDLIRELSINGRRTAQVHYGARGWVAHHNTDLWRQTSPVGDWGHGDATWALWPMAGPWLCHHLWEHFRFTGDRNFLLQKAYPTMKGAAEFCLDFLVDDGQGHLVTNPSTSPENTFRASDGQTAAVSMGSTMDMALIWDLFGNCIRACDTLKLDPEFRDRLRQARAQLLPPSVGADGRLQEWFRDFQDTEVHHRHLSHLWGLYPGSQITAAGTPELFKAARRSLEIRSDEGTGWSSGWKLNLWARLGDGDHAFELIRRTLRLGPGGVYANLFGSHPPFQMDGNFAFPAGVAEMLLQSHQGEIVILPALPKAWPSGRVRGLRARGGFELGFAWKDGRLVEASVRSALGERCKLRCRELVSEFNTLQGRTYRLDDDLSLAR